MRAGIRMRCETDPDKCQGLLGPAHKACTVSYWVGLGC
jgi:hypothetical protein